MPLSGVAWFMREFTTQEGGLGHASAGPLHLDECRGTLSKHMDRIDNSKLLEAVMETHFRGALQRPFALVLGCICMVLSQPAAAQSVTPEELVARYKLFNDCRPMKLLVEHLDVDAAAIGLTKQAVADTVESRLRAADLFTNDDEAAYHSFLYARVTVVGFSYSFTLSFRKPVIDHYGYSGLASTWDGGRTGMHGRKTDFILSGLMQVMDDFLAEYRRANESACG